MAAVAATQISDEDRLPRKVGGAIDEACYCLLDGVDGDDERIQIKVTRLPVKFGRLHETNDPHFVSLGKAKAISRDHARLDFCFPGGFLESDGDGFTFKPDKRFEDAPPSGTFCLTCLSKNKITVNQERLDQESHAFVESGMAIKIGPVCAYFLTPITEEPPALKQRWSLDVSCAIPMASKSMMTNSSEDGGNRPHTHQQLDVLSWDDLNVEYTSAETDRRRQIVGAAILARGVVEAAEEIDQADVSASEVAEWLESSEKYGSFQDEMKTRMEAKSYKAGITKALIRGGFTRTNGSGRLVRWLRPISMRNDANQLQTKDEPSEDPVHDDTMKE